MSILGERLEPLEAAIDLVVELDGYLLRYPLPESNGEFEALDKKVFLQRFADQARAATVGNNAQIILDYNASLKYPSDLEKEQLRILNNYRMLLGVHPLEMDVRLYIAARDHSRDMERLQFFSHDSPVPGKSTFADRAKLAGYGKPSAENIARGQKTSQAVHDGWFGSSGHHKNMVSDHSQIGVGESGFYWTQKFGRGSLLSGRKPSKEIALLIEVLSIPDDAGPKERFRIAQMAASAKQWQTAAEQLELVLQQEPNNEQAQRALDKVREQMK